MKSGWERTGLRDLAIIETGKWDANHAVEGGAYRFYTCAADFMFCNTKRFSGNCLVFPGNGANVGEVYFYNGEFDAYQRTYVLHSISKRLLPRLLYYHFLSNWKSVGTAKQYGSATNFIKIGNFNDYFVSFPSSLPEQQRIVDVLDQEFAKIDALKANAEKSLQAAKDLFSSALSSELRHRAGWKETKIGDFCEIIRGKRFVRADMVEEGVPCIHYGDIYTHYGLYATKAKGCVSPDLAKKLRFAHKNDVIVVAAGENRLDIGVGVAWLGDEPAVVHDACFILKHSQNPMFLSFYFRSAEYHQYLKDEVNEGKICSFLTKPLAEARISLPPLLEQEQIVKRLIIVSNNCTTLQENYQKTLSLCDDLKQALLRKAFNGEL